MGHGGRGHGPRRAARGGRANPAPCPSARRPRRRSSACSPPRLRADGLLPGVGKAVPEGELQSTGRRHEPRPADTSPPPSRRRGMSKVFLAFMVLSPLVALSWAPSATSCTSPLSSLKAARSLRTRASTLQTARRSASSRTDEPRIPAHPGCGVTRPSRSRAIVPSTMGSTTRPWSAPPVNNLNSRLTGWGPRPSTMQLVRSLYIGNEKTYTRKRPARRSSPRSSRTSTPKEWILERYLDSIPYGTVGGQSAIGIKAAAKIYSEKASQALNVREARSRQSQADRHVLARPKRKAARPAATRCWANPAWDDLARVSAQGLVQGPRRDHLAVLHQAPRALLLRLR